MRTIRPRSFHAFDMFELENNDHVVGHDPNALFGGGSHLDFYKARFRHAGPDLHIHVGRSADTVGAVADALFDLVYVDAGHFYEDVKADAREAMRVAKPGGVIIFDDYIMFDHWTGDPYGVVQAVNEMIIETDWKVIGFALNEQMFCNIALSRVPPRWRA
jgi:hypothetical protein